MKWKSKMKREQRKTISEETEFPFFHIHFSHFTHTLLKGKVETKGRKKEREKKGKRTCLDLMKS